MGPNSAGPATIAAGAVAMALAGCSDATSTLAPAGLEADTIARLFRVMATGAVVVWATVVGIALYAGLFRPQPHGRRTTRWLILGGGVITPTLVLGALLLYGLVLMPQLRQPAPHDGLRIAVSGEQWWWRVRYLPAGAEPITLANEVTLANEIRLPVGERVEFILDSPDVIHSFWIPSLAGKVDMIPGRTTTLVLEPTRTGTFGGVCAEYCGTSHALMRVVVVVMEREAFDAWLQRQAAPANPPESAIARAGQRAFLGNGCGACHAIRGTPAAGVVGPDLTHVGSRASLAAGILPNDVAAFRRWIGHTHAVKPEALMPPFGMLPDAEIEAIALYLDGLQ
ncbi:cytochrome c oxidase subunit II [Novilysobacter erysipheiresistens]|uniref:Cytochrome aa3 subunit 2 n=1 Tax=Novilysobacter erysipheiresistens TaxID=1749332 RepID=A0ABU7YZ66_9GAMM